MRVSDAKALIGLIVTLELVGGTRLTTKVESVERDPETGQFYLLSGQLFVVAMQQRQAPKNGRMELELIGVVPYGFPEIAPQKKNSLALDHIVLAQPAIEGFATLYAKGAS